jgi:DNA-binding response OmpR family regulator
VNPTPIKPYSILVVEDEADVRDLIVLSLKREGYQVTAFENAEDAQAALLQKQSIAGTAVQAPFDVAVLDWMLPQMSGLELCQIIRKNFGLQMAVLILTARADTSDKVLGLDSGADDYLSKPFEMREFVARVRALLRRSEVSPKESSGVRTDSEIQKTKPNLIELHGITIDVNRKSVFRGKDEILLTPNEFKLLHEFFKKPGFTYDRETLIRLIQGAQVSVVDRTIDTSILGLRKKLGDLADIIETVRGFGYRLK